jgi:hypothetical protein
MTIGKIITISLGKQNGRSHNENGRFLFVGAAGFEPTTSPTRTARASQAAPCPEQSMIIMQGGHFASLRTSEIVIGRP